MAKTAFLGLGVMGFPMAGHLAAAGDEVAVYNRTVAKSERWTARHGGRAASDPAEAARGAEFVMMCLGDDPDVREIALAPGGVIEALEPGAVLVDHTTASAELARALDEAARARGAHFLDAPVSGGQAGAENGQLTVMCGGEEEAFERARPVIDAYAKRIVRLGPAGAGQLTKMVNQICIAGLLQGLSEAVAFAQAGELDTDAVLDAISGGAAQSWQMENRWKTMCEDRFDFGFAVDWMRKDLRIALDEARRNGAALPITAQVDQLYRLVQQRGGGRFDTSSLVKNLRNS